jgi:hypothetical protein
VFEQLALRNVNQYCAIRRCAATRCGVIVSWRRPFANESRQ